MREALEAVLEKFRPGYQADGSDIFLGAVDPVGTVEVRIPIRPETCVECLLPEDLVATILKREFATVMPDLVRVDVRLFKDAAHA
ncbi:MAG: hypothetical protein ACRENJ_07945 [Candidatus Eiseniibacteriota bacterium]